MNKMKRWTGGILAISVLAGMMVVPAFAASRKKISSISLVVTANVEPGTKYGEEDIDVEIRGGKCTYNYYDVQNVGFEWVEDDVPEIQIFLQADDDYYFSLTTASSVKLSGATYVKASKQDSSTTLALTVKLPSLAENVGEQTAVSLDSNGVAYWEPVMGAGSYEVRLYRNGSGIGASMISTAEPHYDFSSMITREGAYHVRVRAVNKINTNRKSDYAESSSITINEAMLAAIRSGTAQGARPVSGAWIHDGIGWWYRHTDASYTKANWEMIKDQWYFFDEIGYMKTGWIEWQGKRYYCDQNSGAMLKNTTTPDGTILDHEGNPKTS